VREGAVEHPSNHGDMGCPEHQIFLSKGVIGKYVFWNDLEAASRPLHFFVPNKKSHRNGGFLVFRISFFSGPYF
jgi:hypothetical protein